MERLIGYWRKYVDRDVAAVAVADRSLRQHLCTPADRHLLAGWVRRGLVREVAYADRVIIELAERLDLTVVSRDEFKSFRRTNEWVSAHADHFVRWRVVDDEINVSRGLGVYSEQDISRAEQDEEFRDSGIFTTTHADKVLGTRWRCVQPDCFIAKRYPDGMPVLPIIDAALECCPRCRRPVEPVGTRVKTLALQVTCQGSPSQVLLMEDGDRLALGRGDPPISTVLHASPQIPAERVSRAHVELHYHDGKLTARDLNSTNGTKLLRWNPTTRKLQLVGLISAKRTTDVDRRDTLLLAGVLTMRVSGRRWPLGDHPTGGAGAVPQEMTHTRAESQ